MSVIAELLREPMPSWVDRLQQRDMADLTPSQVADLDRWFHYRRDMIRMSWSQEEADWHRTHRPELIPFEDEES